MRNKRTTIALLCIALFLLAGCQKTVTDLPFLNTFDGVPDTYTFLDESGAEL